MNSVLRNRASGDRAPISIFKLVLVVAAMAIAMIAVAAAYSIPSANAADAQAAKAKKKKKTLKPAPAPQNCLEAVKAVNVALRARAVPRYRLKKATTPKLKKKYKKQVKAADRKVNAARAALTVQCQGSGTTSALGAECAVSITKLDKLINLEYDRRIQLKKVKGKSKKAKAKRKVLKKRLKLLGNQINSQTQTLTTACSKTSSGAIGGGSNTGNGGSGSTGSTGSTGNTDTTAPGVVAITGPSTTNDNTPTFVITPPAGENGGRIECKIGDAGYAVVESPYTTTELVDGSHTVTCRYVDEAGNEGDPTSVVVTIDTSAPGSGPGVDVPGSGPDGENNNENPVVEITPPAGETGGHTECKISGAGYSGEYLTWQTVTSPWILPTLPEGTYTITCRWIDEAGNPGPEATYTLTIDRTAPGAPTVTGPGNPTGDNTPEVTITTTEPGGRVKCSLDGNGQSVVTSPVTAPQLSDGSHTISCTQTDAAGNESDAGQTTVVVDTTAPGQVTVSGPNAATSDTTPSFNLSGAGQGDKYECKTGNGSFATTGAVHTTATLADGTHTVTCHLVDAAGNVGPDGTASVTIDTAAPGSVTITGPSVTNDTTPTVTITTSATGGQTVCKVDNGSFAAVTSPWTLPTLSEGAHAVTCHYVSGTGVSGPDSTYTVTIDTTAPSAVTISGPSGLTNDNTPTYTLGGGIGGAIQCKIDNGSFGAAASPFTTAALADGNHTITCRAVDAAGNTTADVTKSITVDTAAPTVTITDGAPRWDGKHDFNVTTNETSTVQCKVDNGSYASVVSSLTTALLGNGSHSLSCIATDSAGNASVPTVKAFGVFKDPVSVSKTGGFQWGLACTGNASLNSFLGCPDDSLSIEIPANPNGLTGNYLVDLTGRVNNLCNMAGFGSTYTLQILVDGASVASDSRSAGIDILCLNKKSLAASVTSLSLSAATAHSIQLSLKSSAFISVLPQVSSSSLSASIHH